MCVLKVIVLSSCICTTCSIFGQTEEPNGSQPEVRALGPLSEVEKDLRGVYYRFFKSTRNPEMHEQGWREIERFMDDPRIYELMLELFEDKPIEIKRDLLELFVNVATEDADVLLAWVAVFDADKQMRTWAAGRLIERVGEEEPSNRIQRVLETALVSRDDDAVVASSSLVRRFNLLQAIPHLIQAQAQPQRREVRRGAIAQIVVGTQQAFVANLTPVVANNAVAYQPTIGVVTDGVVLRVMDAVVWSYRTEVHSNLVGMSSDAWGSSTASMGYDHRKWYKWYEDEFKPTLAAKEDR
jgi:hypothetical protein